MKKTWSEQFKEHLANHKDRIDAVRNLRALYGMNAKFSLRYEIQTGGMAYLYNMKQKDDYIPSLVLREKSCFRVVAGVFTNSNTKKSYIR